MAKLEKALPARTPQRAALADAIAQLAQAEATHKTARDAELRAESMVADAAIAHDAALAALDSAQIEMRDTMMEAARTGSKVAAGASTRLARVALEDAEAALENARAVLRQMMADRAEVEHRVLVSAQSQARAAAAAVLRESTAEYLAETVKMQRELIRRRITLRWMAKAGLITNYEELRVFLQRVCLPDIDNSFGGHHENGWPAEWEVGAEQEWSATFLELQRNPDALPPNGRATP